MPELDGNMYFIVEMELPYPMEGTMKTIKSQFDLWESQFAGTHTEVLAQKTQDFIAAVDELMEKVKSLEAKIKQDGGHVD